MNELNVRIYENGGRKRADAYSHWALAAIRCSIHYLLGQKLFDLAIDEGGEDLKLVLHEAIPTDIRGLLFRINPLKTHSYEWPEYVQLHVLDISLRKLDKGLSKPSHAALSVTKYS